MVPKNRDDRPNDWKNEWKIRSNLRYAIWEVFYFSLMNPVVMPPLKSIVDENLKTKDCPGIKDCQLAYYPENKEGWHIKCSDSKRSHLASSSADW
jgi:hypothetical protein